MNLEASVRCWIAIFWVKVSNKLEKKGKLGATNVNLELNNHLHQEQHLPPASISAKLP